MCPHCKKPKPPPELLAQILSLQNNRTAQMMQGMDYQQPFMMGAMSGMPGMGQQNPSNNQTASATMNNNGSQGRNSNGNNQGEYDHSN
jgi:hypothetical protein